MDNFSQQLLLKAWQLRVEGIDFFKIPSGERFAKYNTDGIVNRITGTAKGYIVSLLTAKATGISELDDKTFIGVYLKGKVKNKDTWFEDAINIAENEEPDPELFYTLNSEQDTDRLFKDRELVKTMLFPAYRAFKESYERHIESDQNVNSEHYNAERDAYLAIKGVMMNLLDYASEDFDEEYESYCEEIESLLTPEEIKEQVNQLRTEENAAIDDDIDNEGQEKDADEDEPEYEVEYAEPAEEEEKQQESADKEQLSNVNFNPVANKNFTNEEFEIFNLNAEASRGGALANRQLRAWQLRVAGIDFYKAPTGQQYKFLEKKSGIYERLTGTVKGYLVSVMHGALTGIKEIDEKPGVVYATGELDKKKWFDHAIEVGKGKNPRPDLLRTLDQGETLEESISLTKEQLLPAYRALKESFERRSFIQWIFNHDQYTAERDSYRAIRGVMMTLLDQTREEFDDTYEQYCKDVKSLLTPKEIKAETKESRRIAKLKAAEKKENVKEIEKNLEQDKSDLQANNNLKDEDTSLEQENEKENVYFGNLFEEKNEEKSEIVSEPEEIKVEEPVVEGNKPEETVVEAPVVEELVVEAPVVEEPVVEEPVDEETVDEETVVEESVDEGTVDEETVDEETVVEEPVVEEPVVEETVVEEPVDEETVVEEPVVEETVVEEPVVEETVVEKTVVEEPKIEETVVEESEPVKLEEKENEFLHTVNRRKGKVPDKVLGKLSYFDTKKEIALAEQEKLEQKKHIAPSNPNLIRESELEYEPDDEDDVIEEAEVNEEEIAAMEAEYGDISEVKEDPRPIFTFKSTIKSARMPQKSAPGTTMGKGDRNYLQFKRDRNRVQASMESGKMINGNEVIQLIQNARENDALTAQVTDQIAQILRDSGGHDAEEIDDLATSLSEMIDLFGPEYKSNTMDQSVKYLFELVFDEINYNERDIKTVMNEAQMITDVLLKNYPPVSIANGELDKYANNYFTSNKNFVNEFLMLRDTEGLTSEQLESLTAEVLGKGRFERAINTPAPVKKEEPAENERMSIPGLKEDVEGKVNTDMSTRVIDEINKKAPSLDNN